MSYSDETLRRPRKVAFYGRVSTELEAQTAALKSQMEWYHKLAAQYPNWSVVNQYADDGVTGTVKEVRRAFMKMLYDAKEGKFDLIVTREVSRFARNTVDTVETVRELRQCGSAASKCISSWKISGRWKVTENFVCRSWLAWHRKRVGKLASGPERGSR